MIELARRLLSPLFPMFSHFAMMTMGRNLNDEWRGRRAVFRAISSLCLIFAFVTLFSPIYALLTDKDPPVSDGIIEEIKKLQLKLDERQKADEARAASRRTTAASETQAFARIRSTAREGVAATFRFPLSGRITGWELYFAFTADCENDLHAKLTSPVGRSLIVMDRGLRRCAGTPLTFSSHNTDEVGALVGSEAGGDWQFVMRDLDANAHAAILESVWMKLTIDNNGIVSEHTVYLDGLPRDIPNPT